MTSARLGPILKAIEKQKHPQKPPHTVVVERLTDNTSKATQVLLQAISDIDLEAPLSNLEKRLINSMVELGVHINTLTDGLNKSLEQAGKDITKALPQEPDLTGVEGEISVAVKEITELRKATNKLSSDFKSIPTPKDVDLSALEQRLDRLEEKVSGIQIPEHKDVHFRVITGPDGFPTKVIAEHG